MTDSEDISENSADTSKENNSQKMGLILGGALVVIIGGFAAWSLLKEEPAPPAPAPVAVVAEVKIPEPDPEPVVEPAPVPVPEVVITPEPEPIPEPEPTPKIVLPALEQSDPIVFKELTDMSWHHDFAALFC